MKFQEDISNMNTYIRTYIHTYIRTSRNQYVPYFFKVGGIIRKNQNVTDGWMDGKTDGITERRTDNVKTVYPP